MEFLGNTWHTYKLICIYKSYIIYCTNVYLYNNYIQTTFSNQTVSPINIATLNDITIQNEATENAMLEGYAERSRILLMTSTTTC